MTSFKRLIAILAAFAAAMSASPLSASLPDAPADFTSVEEQFETITSLVGKWDVTDRDSLKIVFEQTAGGSVIVEKWMRGDRVHSMTMYHRDGSHIIATHYCPQGNQPRLIASITPQGPQPTVVFRFKDISGFDTGESYQHDLALSLRANGALVRSETYWGPEGAGEKSTLILTRAAD